MFIWPQANQIGSLSCARQNCVHLQCCYSEHCMAHMPPGGQSLQFCYFPLLLLVGNSYASYVLADISHFFLFLDYMHEVCGALIALEEKMLQWVESMSNVWIL